MNTLLADNNRMAAHGKHVCELCRHRIAAGEIYRDTRIAYEGTVYTWREHLRCHRFIHEAWRKDPWAWEEGADAVLFANECSENRDLARKYEIPGWVDDEEEAS